MAYIYHMRPPDMVGNILYPLNRLRDMHPEIYARQIAKYDDHPARKLLPTKVVPKLNCLWNDVVQCAPIHPHYIYRALNERNITVNPATQFFQIPVERLVNVRVVIFYDSFNDLSEPLKDEWVQLFEAATYRELTELPAETLKWYDRLAEMGVKRALFAGIPHIFVQGEISVAGLELVSWGQPPKAN
jgi:hypothetical protein